MAENGKPIIDRIVEPIITPGTKEFIEEGKPISSGQSVTLLLLVGRGFGKDPSEVTVSFGSKAVDAFPIPLFNSTQIIVSIPLMPHGQTQVRVTVAGKESNSVGFLIEAGSAPTLPPGTLMKRFLTLYEAFTVLFANEIRIADFGPYATREFREQLIKNILDARKAILLGKQRLEDLDKAGEGLIELMEVKDAEEQERLRRAGKRLAQKLLTLIDEATESSQIIPQLEAVNARLRYGGSRDAAKAIEIAEIVAEQLYHFLEAAQSYGASVGVSEGVLVDAEEYPAEAIMALLAMTAATLALAAKLIAAFIKNEVEREFEEKVFRTLEKLEEKADVAEEKLDKAEGKLDKLEEKFDKAERKIDRLEPKLDRQEGKLDKTERKMDKLEPKLDRQEGKLDKLEGKADKTEVKLDRIEGKLDKNEIKKDRIESKLDKLEPKVDRAESKLDRQESKLDKLERKADKAETKLERIDMNVQKLEGKADKAEGKLDKLEPKIDKIEPKLDKLEPKLDKLEPKIDKIEPKLDQLRVSADKSKEFWQFQPATWNVKRAKRIGVKAQGPFPLTGPTTLAFNVESIQILRKGFRVVKIIVDDVSTDISGRNVVTPSNLLVDIETGVIGASRSVEIEFDKPYTGPIEFNGEKPQGLKLCTVVEGTGASQKSPNACKPSV